MSELDRLKKRLTQILELKQDKVKFLAGLLGIYDNGVKVIRVPKRPGYIYVRLAGNISEVVEAINGVVSEIFDLKVMIRPSETNPDIYEIVGRDKSQYPVWSNTQPYLPRHGNTHSLNSNDPVWIYRKQLVEPLQAHLTSPQSNILKIEPDFYIWDNEIRYFVGGNTVDITVAKPDLPNAYRWMTVYLNTTNNQLGYITGEIGYLTTFFSLEATGVVYNIPEVDPNYSIPLAAVYLTSGTSTIGWSDYQDIRPFIFGNSSSTVGNFSPIKTVSQNYSITNDDYTLEFYATGGVITGTLPNVSGAYNWVTQNGVEYNCKKTDETGNYVVIYPGTGVLIDNLTSLQINIPFTNVRLMSNGRKWSIL